MRNELTKDQRNIINSLKIKAQRKVLVAENMDKK